MAINDFLINSEYPTDKVIFMASGSFTMAGFGFSVVDVIDELGG